MDAFDCLPKELRSFVSGLSFNLRDEHILEGDNEILRIKALVEAGVQPTLYESKGSN